MPPVIESFLAGFPVLMLHSAVTIGMLAVAVFAYVWITPWREMELIRGGNLAAAVSLSGAIVGLALPLAVAMATSVSVFDILVWGVVTLVLQVIAFRLADVILKDLPKRIEAGEVGAALVLVSVKLATAFVNAAAVAG
jgi:putative membrane protein